jgi:alkylhydroperoxidase/carboxymuconolactone decarboxylase family protein YurZ
MLWEGNELSRRERSLITVAALVLGEHSNQLKFTTTDQPMLLVY